MTRLVASKHCLGGGNKIQNLPEDHLSLQSQHPCAAFSSAICVSSHPLLVNQIIAESPETNEGNGSMPCFTERLLSLDIAQIWGGKQKGCRLEGVGHWLRYTRVCVFYQGLPGSRTGVVYVKV